MAALHALSAAGRTDPGLLRDVNEDRFHCDAARGLFAVIDGVGGHAAGGKAADVALAMLRTRLERETGPPADRLREAIAIANSEIYRLASTRAEWNGMACVLTAVVVEHGRATVGHVGDTRLYKLRGDRVEKVTRDHSPVGEREDANELSEAEAMRHPRRNEVYRDVGSDPHEPGDPEFVDVEEIAFEPDAALLLCSDGLTDLVSSAAIARTVSRHAGDPPGLVRALIDAANAAGGKDNVTAVYVEGPGFARAAAPRTARAPVRTAVLSALAAVASAVATFMLLQPGVLPFVVSPQALPAPPAPPVEVVAASESIAAALRRARPGSLVIVEPGEYREQLRLRSDIRVVSRVPRGATLRLPVTATDADPAVVASSVTSAEIVGFRIVGDAATPLGVGLFATDAVVAVHDVEVTGATRVALDLSSGATASVVGADIHDNPGAGLSIRAGATPRIAHSIFSRNGLAEQMPASILIEVGAEPVFYRNVFQDMTSDVFGMLGERARAAVTHDNWFVPSPRPAAVPPVAGRRRR